MLTRETSGVHSKPYQRLRDKIVWSRQHLELSDAAFRILKEFVKKQAKVDDSIQTVLGKGFPPYRALSHAASYVPNAIGFSNQQNYEATLIGSYADFSEYLHGLLGEMYRANPLVVVGKAGGNHQKSFREIVEAGSWETLTDQMIAHVFRRLEEERSTRKLIDRILDNTEVKLDSTLLAPALAYLDLRHIYVHAQGKADSAYVDHHGSVIPAQVGKKLKLSFDITEAGLTALLDLALEIDFQLLGNSFAEPANQNMRSNVLALRSQFANKKRPSKKKSEAVK